MGGSIDFITISPNNRFYCVGLDDNSICLVSSIIQTIEQVIQGLQYVYHNLNPLTTGLKIEPRNHHVVMNGILGSLQFYNANADNHVMDLEVVPMSTAVRAAEKEIVNTHITHVVFLPNGKWIATVDMRPIAITTPQGKTFKVWNLNSNQSNTDATCICRSVGVYRNSEAKVAAFSEDGTVLTQANPEEIENLSFLGDNCPFMIAITKSYMFVWNILICKIWCNYKISVNHFAVAVASNNFAIFRHAYPANQSCLIVFNLKSKIHIALQKYNHTCLAITWLAKEQDELFLSERLRASITKPLLENNSDLIKESSNHNLLNEMYGTRQDERETVEQTCLHLTVVQQICKVAISTSKKENKARRKEGDTGLFASSYVLPQVKNTFDTFMFSLMGAPYRGFYSFIDGY
ncbi:hypothetical protein G6F37_000646 [Rhizopus arrhizus]|nr:hypothetical protein G6F38_000101 [Rhizopus arrhizus]KAG1164045.1 hypothetical protein G6F37_000646 [Rhizopus arrhizus]